MAPASEDFATGLVPVEMLAESLDRQTTVTAGQWTVTPLQQSADNRHLIVVRWRENQNLMQLELLTELIGAVGSLTKQRIESASRSSRLRSMLEMTTRWNQTLHTGKLLEEMAETSTQLLEAQRATIFLWDHSNRQLIGRPAIGVEGGEIRIAEHAGVVGQVVSSGQPIRVDADVAIEQAQIDRSVDQQLGFQTRSLLCVPLINAHDEVVGAFELINKSTGSFTDNDLAALMELAASAAVAISNTQYVQQLVHSRRGRQSGG